MTDPSGLEDDYRAAREKAREFVTITLLIEEGGGDPSGSVLRGQIRQFLAEATPLESWLVVEVLVRTIASTFEDLAEFSTMVLEHLASED